MKSLHSHPWTDTWHIFAVPDIQVIRGQQYRIYVYRNEQGDFSNRVTWMCSDPDENDEYSPGTNDTSDTCDYMFRTYIDGTVDQSMEAREYGYAVYTDSEGRYQEFTPGCENP